MIRHIKKHAYLYALLALMFIAYHRWFSFHIFVAGDWTFMYASSAKDYLQMSIWNALSGFGGADVFSWRLPLNVGYGLFGYFGLDKNISEKFLVFVPTLIAGIVGSYYFLKRYFDERSAFVGAMVINFNTYYLASSSHFLLYSAGVASLLGLYAYTLALDKKQTRYYVLTAVCIFISGVYDSRLIYITAFILFTYALFKNLFYKPTWRTFRSFVELRNHVVMITVLVCLFAYWFSAILTAGVLGGGEVLGRELFGDQYWNLSAALTLFHPFWTFNGTEWFTWHNVLPYFWLVPMFAFAGLYYGRKNKMILYFAVLSLIGIFLAKQVEAPFQDVYDWLYKNLPGFNAFREASKFYYLTALGYAFLTASFISYLHRNELKGPSFKWLSRGLFALISLTFIINLYPLARGTLNSMYSTKSIPSDYHVLNSYLQKDNDDYKTLWVPHAPQWAMPSSKNPTVDAVSLVSKYKAFKDHGQETDAQEKIDKFLLPENDFLLRNNIKYLVVPLRDTKNDNDVFLDYGNDRALYVHMLDQMKTLSKINIGTSDVVVYKNNQYQPLVSSATTINSVTDLSNVNRYANLSKQLGQDSFDYTSAAGDISQSTTKVNDLFASASTDNNIPSKLNITKKLDASKDNKVYARPSYPETSYNVDKGMITLERKGNTSAGITINGQSAVPRSIDQRTVSHRLEPQTEYLINQGQSLLPVTVTDRERSLKPSNDAVVLYVAKKTNIIPDPSFEDNSWRKSIGICDSSPASATTKIDSDSNEHTQGKRSLRLTPSVYIECAYSMPLSVSSASDYILSLDVKGDHSVKAGFELKFNDSKQTIIRSDFNIPESGWTQYRQRIVVPLGSSSAILTLKSYPNNKLGVQTANLYDNVRLSSLFKESELFPKEDTTYKPVVVSGSELNIRYADNKDYDNKNLIENGSLENGLWQNQVGDCNNYDNKPKITMDLDTQNSTDGSKSLRLQAKRHIACVGPPSINVSENGTYDLQFDYLSRTSSTAGYHVTFNDPYQTEFSERIPADSGQWTKYYKQLHVPYGATKMSLIVYAYPEADRGSSPTYYYDNFRLHKVPDLNDLIYLVEAPKKALTAPRSITYEQTHPTKIAVTVHAATTSFFLKISNSYHPDWRIRVVARDGSSSQLDSHNHITLNEHLNGWYVDLNEACKQLQNCQKNLDGSYDLNLIAEFTPQKWFNIGLIISGVTLLISGAYLAQQFLRKPKHSNRKREKVMKLSIPRR